MQMWYQFIYWSAASLNFLADITVRSRENIFLTHDFSRWYNRKRMIRLLWSIGCQWHALWWTIDRCDFPVQQCIDFCWLHSTKLKHHGSGHTIALVISPALIFAKLLVIIDTKTWKDSRFLKNNVLQNVTVTLPN